MQTLVTVVHPRFRSSRVNAALAAAAERTRDVTVRYLYDLYPDGRIDVAAEQAALTAVDRIVLQFPMYWYSSPALLKQWQDDVLTHGWAYGSTGRALAGKELLVAVSTGADDYGRGGSYSVNEPFATTGALSIPDETLVARAREYAIVLTAPRPAAR